MKLVTDQGRREHVIAQRYETVKTNPFTFLGACACVNRVVGTAYVNELLLSTYTLFCYNRFTNQITTKNSF